MASIWASGGSIVVRPAHQGCQVRYGFLIDHNRCIGCHACTVACKDEHSVPVGVSAPG